LDRNLIIPPDYVVEATGGVKLDLIDGAKIISYSPLKLKGTSQNPIEIHSSNGTGQGVFVLNTNERSILQHVIFSNLSAPKQENWNLTGAVNFYEAPVSFDYVTFKNNRSEDALNVSRTNLELRNTSFSKTQSDAFDGDFVTGNISNVTFEDLGNDAIDLSGSKMKINQVRITNAGDKGLSAGEKSSLEVSNLTIIDSEIAVASKDLSVILLDSVSIKNCKVGYTAFQKKSEFGPSKIYAEYASIHGCVEDFLVENASIVFHNDIAIQTQAQVIERMYGREFGKISN